MPLFTPLNPPIASYAGLRIWLVGASTGIGAALAERLIGAGARVAVSARSADKLEAAFAGRATLLPLDMTDPAALQAAADRLAAEWGGYDLVLAIAGTYAPMRADRYDAAGALETMALNLGGVFKLWGAVQRPFLAQGRGGFGIVSSVAGYGGLPNSMAYGATKAACNNLAQSMYLDLHRHGLAVYLVTPGFVATPLTANNPFPMPFLISAEEAAREITEGMARGDFEIHFPRRFSRLLKFMNLLPHRLYFWLVRKGTGL
jgi:NAD(P)-dependent dehydrogenase (short-subunit alcohol dehydrogenase family)